MPDIDKVIKGFECCVLPHDCSDDCPYSNTNSFCTNSLHKDALELLKELKSNSTIGMQITGNGITFISTGDAKQGEERGLMLGKAYMKEHIEKELLYKNLLTDEIREIMNRIV